MEAEPAKRRRLLTSGDVEGKFAQLFQQVENQQKRMGAFDVLFAVGGFLPGTGPEAKERASVLAEYVSGKRTAPVETYFIERNSAAFIQAAPEGRELFKGVHFLGGFGIKEVQGLRIAFLSGHYDPKVYREEQAGAAGAPFVGAAFTVQAVQGLIRLAQQPGAAAIDILLTADWPTRIEDKLEDSQKPRHPDDEPVKWHEVTAPPVAELVLELEPRYHLFGGMDIFYQRAPFQTRNRGHVSRCIGLGKVGSKGKGRTWIHGLQLSPAAEMTSTALMQRPENTTPCPFIDMSALKRKAAELNGTGGDGGADDEPEVVPDQVFLSRLPPHIEEKRIEKALKNTGTILRIHLARDESVEGKPCRGFGWVTFSTPEEAQAACELSELLECGGRKIAICLSHRSKNTPKQAKDTVIAIEPHPDCWFCLVNPKAEKHLIVDATPEVYIAIAKGPIHPTHVLVLPVKHAPSFAACPPEVQQSLVAHLSAIRRMCRYSGQDIIAWERWIPMANSAANHMMIQVVPIEEEHAAQAREVLLDVVEKHLQGVPLKKLSEHGDVSQHLNDDVTTPYIYFEVPGDGTARGREVERYVHSCVGSAGPRIPVNLGRIWACQLLHCEDRLDWRQCQDDRRVEKELAQKFRTKFLPFQPSPTA